MMEESEVKVNSMKAWILAARPKTLAGAAVPVMIGTAMALRDAAWHISAVPAVLCFLFAFIMQIDANFVNDYFDFVRGNDDETRLGPRRACAQGWVTMRAMKSALVITTALACIAGLPLVLYGGMEMIFVGIVCVLFCFLYTTRLSYIGMGDILVIVFFGLVPVTMTYYLEMPRYMQSFTTDAIVASVACGLVVDALLIVNNYRDIDNDRKAGKTTLVVSLGPSRSRRLYLSLGIIACLMGGVLAFHGSVLGFRAAFCLSVLSCDDLSENGEDRPWQGT
jgi:1,4-dihydroxy-2-naphthoate octaprenyltransferase